MASRFIVRAAAFAVLCGVAVALAPGHARADIAAALGEAPQGYGRATTGGCTEQSCKCTVTTLKDEPANVPGSLRSCVETEGAKWVVFAARGTISLARPLKVASHKLIDGRKQKPDDGPVTLAGSARFLLHIEGAEDIAVSDLYFRPDAASPNNPAATPACRNPQRPTDTYMCGHPIAVHGAVRNVWINHNNFDHCGDKCITVWTASGQKGESGGKVAGGDLVTISNNVFRDSFYAVLVGAAAPLPRSSIPDEMRVTLYGNMFYNVKRRSPRAASFTKVHAFNNVMKFWGDPGESCERRPTAFAASSIGEAQLLLENNVLIARPDGCKIGVQISEKGRNKEFKRDVGLARATGNKTENGATVASNEPDKVFKPDYSYTLRPTDKLADEVARTAGVRDFPKEKF